MKTSVSKKVSIAGTGVYLPETVYTNQMVIDIIKEHLPKDDPRAAKLDPTWIEQNIGIKERRFADFDKEETPVNMSKWSLEAALEKSGWTPDDLDVIIVSSVSSACGPNLNLIPSIACQVQQSIGAWNASAYDMLAACSGWTYASSQAIAQIASGLAKKVAVICCETQKRGLDFTNPVSSVLIGDVAACTLFESSTESKVKYVNIEANRESDELGIITLNSPNIWGDKDIPGTYEVPKFELQGKTVFKSGVRRMSDLCTKALSETGLETKDVDHFVFHQANGAMLLMVGSKLGLSPEQVPITLDVLANTTSGTIPSVLHKIESTGKLKRGDNILFVSFGGGITSGAILMEY